MAINTSTELKGAYPDVSFPARDVVPQAAIYSLTTVGGEVEGDAVVMRVPFVQADPSAGFVPEGADITVSDPQLAEVEVVTGKIAVLTKQSNESARHLTAAQLVADSMSHAIVEKANLALFGNATTPTGLFVVSGVTTVSTSFSTVAPSLAPIIEGIVAVESEGGQATNLVMHPEVWGALLEMATDGQHVGSVALPSGQFEKQVLGLPVLTDANVPTDAILVVDRSQIVSAVGPVRLETSDAYFFGSDSLARRATWRIGWNLVRPERIAKIAVVNA